MFKKIIAVFLLVSVLASASAVASFADTWTDGGASLKPLQMVSIKSIYAGVSGVPNGNYNDITGYSGGVTFTPNTVGASGYTASALKVQVNENPQTSVDATAYYFDFVISFASAEFEEYEININFSTPRHLNTNGVSGGNDSFDFSSNVKCYYEEFYNANTRRDVTADTYNPGKCSISYKGSAYKLHVHLSCISSSSLGLYYAYLQLSSVQVTKVNMTKSSIYSEKEEAEKEAESVQEQAEDSSADVSNSVQQTVNAFGTIGSAMSTSSTNVSNWKLPAMYIPATSVTPRIELSSEKDINFKQWIDSIPTQWMTLIRIICSIAIFVFCGKEIISILSILLNNRDSIDGLTHDINVPKKDKEGE